LVVRGSTWIHAGIFVRNSTNDGMPGDFGPSG